MQTDPQIRIPHLVKIDNKKRSGRIVDFADPADMKGKIKENEQRDKYFNLARELIKGENMKLAVIPIVICAFGTVPKGLIRGHEEFEIEGRAETIQTTALLRSARILR